MARIPGEIPAVIDQASAAVVEVVKAALRGDVVYEDKVQFLAFAQLALEVTSADIHLARLALANASTARTLARLAAPAPKGRA